MNVTSPMPFSMKYAEAVQTATNIYFTQDSWYGKHGGHKPEVFEVQAGQKYDKVVNKSQGGIHAFVVRETGDVLKPASYKVPAKGVRGNVATEEGLEELMMGFDPFGGYLYMDAVKRGVHAAH